MSYIKVKDKEHWFRNTQSGSIQCSDTTEYERYMASYRSAEKKEQEFQTLQNEVSELKSELGDIKSLLLTLVQNQNHDD
ncbi:hypothetical protein [Synechococcus phage S-H25]|nr:hypothetical protein [Synechococcus phage S-H25]